MIVAGSQITLWVATFAFTVAQARYLEPTRFGQLSLALAYAGFLTIFIDFGTSTLLSRMVAQRSGLEDGAVAATLLVRLGLWLVALPLLLLATVLLGYDADLRGAILVLALAALFASFGTAVAAYLQGREEFSLPWLRSSASRSSHLCRPRAWSWSQSHS